MGCGLAVQEHRRLVRRCFYVQIEDNQGHVPRRSNIQANHNAALVQLRFDQLTCALGFEVPVGAVENGVRVQPQRDPTQVLGRELDLVVTLLQ